MTMDVRVEGPRIRARFNGTPVIDFTDTSSSAASHVGHIGLQMNGGAVAFRNIALRPLGTRDLFDGRDLDGWHVVPGSKTQFDVADGTIHAAGGPGFLESNETFADFVLQFDAKTNGTNLNSGVFFRAMRGTARAPSNGYELQIHNGFKHGDRTDPVDAGTGAIYRRTKARWVIPDDRAWFTSTLIANQAHFSIWVNGVQVTDWTDPRRDDPNPRRGRRLEAGHLSLQGHDRTTDLNFRRLRIAALPGTALTVQGSGVRIRGQKRPKPSAHIPRRHTLTVQHSRTLAIPDPWPKATAMRTFKSLSEQEILALAISLEEEDARIYDDFAERLKGDYPATAKHAGRNAGRRGRPSASADRAAPRRSSASISRSSAGRT